MEIRQPEADMEMVVVMGAMKIIWVVMMRGWDGGEIGGGGVADG